MELKNAESDLQSLRRLYGLLQSNAANEPISKSNLLDERSQVLLKRLLDAATEELLVTQSKARVKLPPAQLGLSDTISSGMGQVKGFQKLKALYTHDEELLAKQMPSTEQSHMSLSSNISEIRKSRCRVCQEKSTQQQSSGMSPCEGNRILGSDATMYRIGIHQLRCSESNASSVARSSRSLVSGGVKLPCSESIANLGGQTVKNLNASSNDLAEEVADAIERIETQILALRLCSNHVESNDDSALNRWLSRESMLAAENKVALAGEGYGEKPWLFREDQREPPTLLESHLGTEFRKSAQASTSGRSSSNMQLSQQKGRSASNFSASPSFRTGYSVNAAEKREREKSFAAAESQCSRYVNGLRVMNQDNQMVPLRPHNSPSLYDQLVPVETRKKMGSSRPPLPLPPRPARSVGFRKTSKKSGGISHKMMNIRPTLLDQESQSWHEDPRERKRGRTRSPTSSEDELFSVQEESEETNSVYMSSSSTSQPDSVSETSVSSSSRCPESSEEMISSSRSPQSESDDRASPHKRPHRSSNHANLRKSVISRFKRFKNKLGLIFHHHHHHHHHHHNESEDSDKPSTWRKLRRFHQKANGRSHRRDEKGSRPRNREATRSLTTRKHQIGHFHALVERLMRHLKHSKKSKALGTLKSRGGNSHWWQMFKRRGGVKLPGRGRVKLGYGGKRQARTRLSKKH